MRYVYGVVYSVNMSSTIVYAVQYVSHIVKVSITTLLNIEDYEPTSSI